MAPRSGQAVFLYDGHFPEAILEVLAKQSCQRGTRLIPGHDFRRLPDPATCANQAQVQLVVLVANKTFVEESNFLQHFPPPAPKVYCVHWPSVVGLVPPGTTNGEG